MTEQQMENLDIFDNAKWSKLTIEERKGQLQQLENYYAEKEGRAPITLQYVPTSVNAGAFDARDYSITLNESYVNGTSNDPDYDRYQIIDAVIHEGKHADQYTVLHEVEKGHKYQMKNTQI